MKRYLSGACGKAMAGAALGLVVVWFAGGGGSSLGIKWALGVEPDFALNHSAVALGMHAANHRQTVHLVEDAHAPDPVTLGGGGPVDLFWASPDCTHHSKARGQAPCSERIRGLCWVVADWADLRGPRVIILENVEEFQKYGPLFPEGHEKAGRPDPAFEGVYFQQFVERLRNAPTPYRVEWRELVCADYGDPTIRKRLFLIARNDGEAIAWPEREFAPRHLATAQGLKPWRGAHEAIDFSKPCPSIFCTTKEAKAEGFTVRRPLVKATMKRLARGIERYVIDSAEPFIVPITHAGDSRVHGVRDPIRTVTAAPRGEFALAGAFLTPRYGERAGQEPRSRSVRPPYPAVVPDGNGGGLAAVYLDQANTRDVGAALADPARTQTGHAHQAVVAAFLGRQFGSTVSGRDLRESAPTIMGDGGGGKTQLCAVNLISYYGTGVGSDIANPARVITGEDRHGLSAAWLEQANTGMVGHHARSPVSTLVGKGCTQRVAEARLEAIGAPPGARRRAVIEFLWEHFGAPTEAEWADPLATRDGRLKFGLVVLDGVVFEIADIGLRMLFPRELFNAQGFPPSYIIDRDASGRPITGTQATLMAGNAVPPHTARALVRANCAWRLPQTERLAA